MNKKLLLASAVISLFLSADDTCLISKKRKSTESVSKLQTKVLQDTEDFLLECSKLITEVGNVMHNAIITGHEVCEKNDKIDLKKYSAELENKLRKVQQCCHTFTESDTKTEKIFTNKPEGK